MNKGKIVIDLINLIRDESIDVTTVIDLVNTISTKDLIKPLVKHEIMTTKGTTIASVAEEYGLSLREARTILTKVR